MEIYLQECPQSSDHCRTELAVDWLSKGKHIYTLNRGCSRTEVDTGCPWEGANSLLQYKDCWTSCNTTACNDGDEAFKVFAENTSSNVASCYACEVEYFSNGTVFGDSNCVNMTGMNRINDCPPYAQNSCSTSAMHLNITEDDSSISVINTFYRSCSPFAWSGQNNQSLTGLDFYGYKDICASNNCNNQTYQIDNDSDVYCRFESFIK